MLHIYVYDISSLRFKQTEWSTEECAKGEIFKLDEETKMQNEGRDVIRKETGPKRGEILPNTLI